MKLTEIQIDRHGIWRNVTLPVPADGLSVFYGPNEAGKSSLRKFIRGVLFGFSSPTGQSDLLANGRFSAAGSLQIEDAAGTRRIHRAAVAGSAGDARLITDEAAVPVAALSQGVATDIDEQLFDRLFAVDLRELCEINSLAGDEMSRHLFGLSFGSRGQQIVEAQKRIEDHRRQLVDPIQQTGDLLALFAKQSALTARLTELASLRDRHTEWSLRRDQLEREIADLRARHAGTGEQLRGHVFLERAWGPWNRIRECKTELDELPEVVDFPERGIERLEKLDGEIAKAAESRDSLVAEARQLRNELLHPADGALSRRHAATVQGFVDQRGWLAALKRQCDAAQIKADESRREFETACAQLGADWTATRVAATDVSAAAERRLSGTADSFRAAVSRRKVI
ncbi:MAG TPA: AAA family ATPase, partial [Planctomycetaceae bacterium]